MNYEEIFDIFKSSYVGKEIRKDIILNRLFNAEDKEIIERFVTNIYIKYSVKAENINKKAEKNFEEIQIIEININNYRAIYDIYGILLSIIPYPILAIFRYNDRASFALSNRILAEDKNNKGKIYTSYLIKEEEIGSYLKIDIDNCQTMIDVYNKWIYNIDNVVAYYDRLDRIIEFIEIGFHIKSNEVLEKLESYITRDCGTYNMKPRDGWKSKLDKYSDNPTFVKKIETHILWEYLFENTFLRNKLENFSSWSDFKWACVYNNRPNDIYYSQYNSRMSENYDIYEEKKNNRRYSNYNIKTKVEIIKNEQVPVEDTVKLIKDKSTDNRNIKFSEYQEQLLQTLENEPTVLENADYETRDNSDFMLQAIEIDGINIIYASDELKNNEKFILEAIKIERVCLKYASDRLKNNSDFMLCASEIDERVLASASDELKANKSFILKAAENSIWALAYATDELKDDKEFVLQIVEINSWTFKHASDRLKNDKDVALKAIEKDSWFLVYARNELRNNRKFLLEAINKRKECMAFANDNMKKEILSNTDENNLIDDDKKDNEEYMLKLIRKDYFNIRFASDRLKNDSKFILNAMKINDMGHHCLAFASDELKSDKKFMLKVFKKIGNYTFAFASERLKCDKEFILKLLEFNYLDFSYVNYELRKDKEFMMKAISKNAETIEFADYELRNDKEFVLQAIKINPLCFVYASDELKNNKEFMLQAIDEDVAVIEYAKDIFRDDEDVALAALEIDTYGLPLSYISDRLRNDKEFILRVVDINSEALKYLGDKLKNDKEFMNKINDIIEDRIILKINYVFKEEILYRNEIYGIVGYLEKIGINVLEKNGFCMKIAVVETGQISEYSNVPLNLITDTLKELEMKKMKYIIIDWKLYLSGVTEENLKSFDDYMRTKKRTYSIYKNKKM